MSDENKQDLAFALLLMLGTEGIKVVCNYINRGLAQWQSRKEEERRRTTKKASDDERQEDSYVI